LLLGTLVIKNSFVDLITLLLSVNKGDLYCMNLLFKAIML